MSVLGFWTRRLNLEGIVYGLKVRRIGYGRVLC